MVALAASPFAAALLLLFPLATSALPATQKAIEKRDTINGYPVLRDLQKRQVQCSNDEGCTGHVVPVNAYPFCAFSICSYRCEPNYVFNFWPTPSCVSSLTEAKPVRILAAAAQASSAEATASSSAATIAAATQNQAAAEEAVQTAAAAAPTEAARSTGSASSTAAAATTTSASGSGNATAKPASTGAAAVAAAQTVVSVVTVTAEPVTVTATPSTITVTATGSAAAAAATVTVTVTQKVGSGSAAGNNPYGVYSSGGDISQDEGNGFPLNYTIPLSLPANTSIIPGNILANKITGFGAQNLTNNTGAIASWFRTDNAADSTNGHSWCYNPYNDSMPGFAPSFKTMVSNYGGDPIKAGQAYCGLEAIFYTPDGRNATLYVIDAFDDKWVKTPSSVDVVIGAFPELFGTTPASKNDVVMNVSWHFTGNRSTDYIFNNGRNAALTPSGSSSSSSSSSSSVSAAPSYNAGNFTGTYSGTATYFTQNGNAGNCGTVHADSVPLVALTTAMYGSGSLCGQTVQVCATDNGKCVSATVQDSCPTCLKATDLDLSVAAFEALDHPLSAGVIPITWSFTNQ